MPELANTQTSSTPPVSTSTIEGSTNQLFSKIFGSSFVSSSSISNPSTTSDIVKLYSGPEDIDNSKMDNLKLNSMAPLDIEESDETVPIFQIKPQPKKTENFSIYSSLPTSIKVNTSPQGNEPIFKSNGLTSIIEVPVLLSYSGKKESDLQTAVNVQKAMNNSLGEEFAAFTKNIYQLNAGNAGEKDFKTTNDVKVDQKLCNIISQQAIEAAKAFDHKIQSKGYKITQDDLITHHQIQQGLSLGDPSRDQIFVCGGYRGGGSDLGIGIYNTMESHLLNNYKSIFSEAAKESFEQGINKITKSLSKTSTRELETAQKELRRGRSQAKKLIGLPVSTKITTPNLVSKINESLIEKKMELQLLSNKNPSKSSTRQTTTPEMSKLKMDISKLRKLANNLPNYLADVREIKSQGSISTKMTGDEFIALTKLKNSERSYIENRLVILAGQQSLLSNTLLMGDRNLELFNEAVDTGMGKMVQFSNSQLNQSNQKAVTDKDISNACYKAIASGSAFLSAHPFDDGNGRTSRALMNNVLQSYGLDKVDSSDLKANIGFKPDQNSNVFKDYETNEMSLHALAGKLFNLVSNSEGFIRNDNLHADLVKGIHEISDT
ncbi:Fic family protein [uncultured Shewanella sp.]|uniref:Fic family protein n=1 Tax=uncultured Shewanella sp. TaxID=173975 RepID=UPI00260601D4|nr:Fic family protein [uncultured Shewanella sp.]